MKRATTTIRAMPVALLAAGLTWAAGGADEGSTASRAVDLYNAGDCAAATPLLLELAEGEPTGPMLYRLYYCQRQLESPEARGTMLEARTALEAELDSATSLEVPFYLANVYRSSGRLSAAAEIAAQATARVESGSIPEPTAGLESFQLGKLYADQDRADQAAKWYARSLEQLRASGESPSPSLKWAARFLARTSFDAGEYEQASDYFAIAAGGDDATTEDLDRWATAAIRQRDYATASKVWFRALKVNPGIGDNYRYAAQLAYHAQSMEGLSETAPDGRAWTDWSQAELEEMLLERSTFARELIAKADAAPELPGGEIREMQKQLAGAHATFMSGAIEYAVRGLPIRETAFRSGYAPMIFHASRWKILSANQGPLARKPKYPK